MKEVYAIAKEVKNITDVNFLEKKRQTEHVEARSFFVHILKNYYKLRNRDIINVFNNLGFKMDSATLCHAVKMFEVYETNNMRMQEWFDKLFEKPDFKTRRATQAYIRSKLKYLPEDALNKIASMINTIVKENLQEEELEKITWDW